MSAPSTRSNGNQSVAHRPPGQLSGVFVGGERERERESERVRERERERVRESQREREMRERERESVGDFS